MTLAEPPTLLTTVISGVSGDWLNAGITIVIVPGSVRLNF